MLLARSKLGTQLSTSLNSTVEFSTFYSKNFGPAYYTLAVLIIVQGPRNALSIFGDQIFYLPKNNTSQIAFKVFLQNDFIPKETAILHTVYMINNNILKLLRVFYPMAKIHIWIVFHPTTHITAGVLSQREVCYSQQSQGYFRVKIESKKLRFSQQQQKSKRKKSQ